MDLWRCLVQLPAQSRGSFGVRLGCAGFENLKGWSLHGLSGQPTPLLPHPPENYILAENVGLLNGYCFTEAEVTCFMDEHQFHDCRN